MGRKRKQTQHFAKPKQAMNKVARSRMIRLAVSPEQLIKNGDIPKAIDEIQRLLTTEPIDEHRRLLGDCYFRIHDYKEAANAWLTIKTPTADDLSDAGLALLCEGEWERAKSALQRSLDIEELAYALYLQALAIKGNREYYSLRGEERTSVTDLLQKAQTLPGCPAGAFLLLDDLLNRHESTSDRTALLEDAVLLYPDHAELRLRYVRHLTYETHAYSEALIAAAALLSQEQPSQRALDCAVRSAFKLGLFEDALTYVDQLRPTPSRLHGSGIYPGIDQIKGDIYLAWGKTEEALACYEREAQFGDFEDTVLSLFRIAKVWLTLNECKKALRAALEGVMRWLDYPNDLSGDGVLSYCEVLVGEADDLVDVSLHFSGDVIKEVCETLLSSGQEIAIDERGRLAYLLYKVHEAKTASDDEPEMDALLLMVEQGTIHPHMGEVLAAHYTEKGDVIRALQVHLDYCVWKFFALEKGHPQPAGDDDNQHIGWTFYEDTAELSCDQELLDALSEVDRGRCHTIAWEALQAHIAESDIVASIFVPLFDSLWSDVLIAGNMHREMVETARLLIQVATDDEVIWWLLAYHLRSLEQNDEAERAYRRYLELVPDSADAMHNLSLILQEKGALQEALALSEKAASLSPEDEIIVKNFDRLTHISSEREQEQQKQEGAAPWSGLTDSQKWLLCLLELYPSSHWSGMLPRIKQDERQLRQLQEDWEWLLAQRIFVQSEAEEPVRIAPPLEPYASEEGFRYWLATELARVQIRKKKNLWLPAADELGDKQLIGLDAPQRDLLQQAFMRQIDQVSSAGLEKVYLHFYRRIWKRLLIEWNLHSKLVDCCNTFLTRLPSIMTRQEMWECAYYATGLSDYTYQNRAEKWYKAYLEQKEDFAAYHNLSVMYSRRKAYQEALQMIEQALRLAPENQDSLKQKAQIQQAIQKEEEQKRQQELERAKQQELREQQHKAQEQIIVDHLGNVDPYKQKILRALKDTRYFPGKKALARDLIMEERVLEGHWKKLVAWGMIIENGRQLGVHPVIATYLEQGWTVTWESYKSASAPQAPFDRKIASPNTTGSNLEGYIVSHAVEIIERLARNFHLVVRKLNQRYNDRPPLEIRDEYDVQDLFYALLTPFFEDIRPEEVAPSHAGGHGRIDFLIKAEQIVIEIKKMRPSLKTKEVRDQLIVDKDIYRTHPDCRTFVAFIYDPDGYIDNPRGFENDLSNTAGDMRVNVIVAPR